MRWIWIDRFVEFHSGRSAKAVKTVSVAEDHVHEQYPGYPVLPPSLILEGLAQTGGILVGEANDFKEKVVLAKVPRVEFFDYATAGDVLHYEVRLNELRHEGAIVDAWVTRDGKPFAEAEIVFAHLDNSRGVDDGSAPKNFVFTKDHLMALLHMAQAGDVLTSPKPAKDAAPDGAANGKP
ncbi:MAG: beta-hydroxyacyl-ACP dehydratase [Planctomycetia bacterium]